MTKNEIMCYQNKFNEIMHELHGYNNNIIVEYWNARELMIVLGYKQWRKFEGVITRAMQACAGSGYDISNHFRETSFTVNVGHGYKEVSDYMLTRYACYLVAMNGDPRKKEISFAQSYFAIQTNNAEMMAAQVEYDERINIRNSLITQEKSFSGNMINNGVTKSGVGRIRSKGDQVLFGGNTTQDMKDRLEVPDGRPLADYLDTIAISAKSLATQMTNHNIKVHNLYGEDNITDEHVTNNGFVRESLLRAGIVPEDLPPREDIKKLERRINSNVKNIANNNLPTTKPIYFIEDGDIEEE